MKDIFYELIEEAMNAKVILDGDEWPIGFNTIIGNKEYFNKQNLSTLVIKNEEEFLDLLQLYINKELKLNRNHIKFVFDKKNGHIKSLLSYLFVNMSTEDFLNPTDFLRRRIAFIEDKTFSLFNEEIPFDSLPDSKLKITQNIQSIYMETPYIMDFSVVKDGVNCQLPCISYGICEENGEQVCYIYSIMNRKSNNKSDAENKLINKVNRIMYKLNSGVYDSESQDYKDYHDGKTTYYPENISDVTPSFVFVLMIFFNMLYSKGISDVRCVPYLPVRYLSRAISANRIQDENRKKFAVDRLIQVQNNTTDKFLRNFRRAAYHMDGLEIISYPYELDENMRMRINSIDNNSELLRNVSQYFSSKHSDISEEALSYVMGTNGLEDIKLSREEFLTILKKVQDGKKDSSFLYELVMEIDRKNKTDSMEDKNGRRRI